jgi:outer membrane immunogenic protein
VYAFLDLMFCLGAAMKTILLASTFLFAVSGGAFAADAIINDPAPEAAPAGFIWTGGYVGIVAGVNFLKGDMTIPAYVPPDYNTDSTSGAIGGKVGYNYQFENNVVIGAEASLVAVFNKGSDDTIAAIGETIHASADWQAQIVAKAGYAAGRLMPYVKGGVAFLHADDIYYDSGIFGQSDSLSRTYTGWTIGVGVDYALTDNLIFGVDYSFADFGSHDFANSQIGPTILKPSTHTVSASLSYKF